MRRFGFGSPNPVRSLKTRPVHIIRTRDSPRGLYYSTVQAAAPNSSTKSLVLAPTTSKEPKVFAIERQLVFDVRYNALRQPQQSNYPTHPRYARTISSEKNADTLADLDIDIPDEVVPKVVANVHL